MSAQSVPRDLTQIEGLKGGKPSVTIGSGIGLGSRLDRTRFIYRPLLRLTSLFNIMKDSLRGRKFANSEELHEWWRA